MFLMELKHMMTTGMKQVFQSPDYPITDFAGWRDSAHLQPKVSIGIDYPVDKIGYPGVWVDFEATGPLMRSGIDDGEYVTVTDEGEVPGIQIVRRWEFKGVVTFTVFALASMERDALFDEIVRIIAFGHADPTSRGLFRQYLVDSPLLGVTVDFDSLQIRGASASPGTPWGGDEVVYEITVAMSCIGDFAGTESGVLVPVSAVEVIPTVDTSNPVLS